MRAVSPVVLLVLVMSVSEAAPLPSTGLPAVDTLVADGRHREALEKLLPKVARAKNDDERGRRLVAVANLKAASGEVEGAVTWLRAQPWPAEAQPRAGVALTYAHLLRQYLQFFRHEISGRDAVEGALPDDLKLWSEAQLEAETWRALSEAWARRAQLGDAPVTAAPWLEPNTLPASVRGRLRDALSFLVADFLQDTSLWAPGQEEDVAALPLDAWAAGKGFTWSGSLERGAAHPLAEANGVLADLEAWHLGKGRAEGALEASRSRHLLLHARARAELRPAIRASLEARMAGEETPWASMAHDAVAGFLEEEGNLEAAWKRAAECRKTWPSAPGGKACAARAERLGSPTLALTAMSADVLGRRSLRAEYRNAHAIHFRAWRVPDDLALAWVLADTGDSVSQQARIAKAAPAAEWSVEVKDPGDRQAHQVLVAPPMKAAGTWLVHASPSADFAPRHQVQGLTLDLCPWSLVPEPSTGHGLRAWALDGEGKGVAGVSVEAWQKDWRNPAVLLGTVLTGADGLAQFPRDVNPAHGSILFVARRGTEWLATGRQWAGRHVEEERRRTQVLVSTDRAVYRPGQVLRWKAVLFEGARDRWKAKPGQRVVLRLLDAQGNEISQVDGTSNEWGSLSGSVPLPVGRLLGDWSLSAELGGGVIFKVEEYKRPTFEVSVDAPAGEPALGREVQLSFGGKYLFGLPVTSGRYRWKVVREPRYPRWWWDWAPRAKPELIASGSGAVDPALKEGKAGIRFTPAVPPGAQPGVTWSYTVSVDVTDEGGETRSGSRTLLLGLDPVAVDFELPASLGVEGKPLGAVRARRSTLGGEPRAGEGRWGLVKLVSPSGGPRLPDQLPASAPGPFTKPAQDDRARPRWSSYPEDWTLQLADWTEGERVAGGTLTHGADGWAELSLPALEGGVYRLVYLGSGGGDAVLARRDFPVVAAGKQAPVALWMQPERGVVDVGEQARLALGAGWGDLPVHLEIHRRDGVERQTVTGKQGLWTLPITDQDRGGVRVLAWAVRDSQWLSASCVLAVPWTDKQLKVTLETFRDTLEPGQGETWTVRVTGPGKSAAAAQAELLALMYDRSLDVFAPHAPLGALSIWPGLPWRQPVPSPFHREDGQQLAWAREKGTDVPHFSGDALRTLPVDVWGGRGGGVYSMRRIGMVGAGAPMAAGAPAAEGEPPPPPPAPAAAKGEGGPAGGGGAKPPAPPVPLRENFSETAFFLPHVVTDGAGRATLSFQVPESVTGWRLLVGALDKEARSGVLDAEARTVKRLMVRPYLPRFLREGDEVELRFAVQNNSDKPLAGEFQLQLEESGTQADAAARFGLQAPTERVSLAAGASTTLRRRIKVPAGEGALRVKASVRAGGMSDGELRELPLLPSRVRLVQSRTAVLNGKGERTLQFRELGAGADRTRVSEQLAVTVDGQLFQAVLEAVPYLVEYPYECTEQTLNRFVSTSILAGTFERYPAVAAWAREAAAKRGDKPVEAFDGQDANRLMRFEESPWLRESKGGEAPPELRLKRVLDPAVATADRLQALEKLRAAQASEGGFPWFAGGEPSVFLTTYILQGFARAEEAGAGAPADLVERGWRWLGGRLEHPERDGADDVFLNYVASGVAGVENFHALFAREKQLERAMKHYRQWKAFPARVKALLALTLHRLGKKAEGRRVLAAVMDGAKMDATLGTYWAAEDRSWMWFNDTTETHATALRVLLEMEPEDKRLPGLAQWLLLDKKLGHWKSTRATAEAVDALSRYLAVKGELGQDQAVSVKVGGTARRFEFKASSGDRRQQWVLPGSELTPASGTVKVENLAPGVAVATATWRFTTDVSPAAGDGDLLAVSRRYFRRELRGKQEVLVPLGQGDLLSVGDEVEEHLSLRAKHAAEYVHLRAPRGAGFEPGVQTSGWRWQTGLGYYEEVRDSAENLFFERLPAGEYTLKLKLRVAASGTFRVGPATLQSLYAPEFTAYSAGAALGVR
ncbi:MAG: hypothetical protein RL653_3969 [Pseudomonadota bacterium]|jgi:hypothetical protein